MNTTGITDRESVDRTPEVSRRVHRTLLVAVVALVLATACGLAALWPSGHRLGTGRIDTGPASVRGTVVAVASAACPESGGTPGPATDCRSLRVELTSGPDKGTVVPLFEDGSSGVGPGDRIILTRTPDAPSPELEYAVSDIDRRVPLLVLAGIFVLVVVALGRWRGALALLGFALSLGLLVVFVLPAILAGESPVAVAITGSAAVMLLALYLAHGVNVRTTTAVLGTLASLLLTALLALLFVEAARLTGFTSDEAIFLSAAVGQINLRGVLLASMVIGALGVLDDVTVTQASAVWELRLANPSMAPRDLYRSAMRIGRDHIASTVNTLVLAYAGASLPLLVLFTLAGARITEVLNGEVVAEEVVRTLVGSIGLIASVPITTALAVLVTSKGRRAPGTGTAATGPTSYQAPPVRSSSAVPRTVVLSAPHAHMHGSRESSQRDERRLLLAVLPFVLATFVGLVVLWPGRQPDLSFGMSLPKDLVEAVVRGVTPVPCAPGDPVPQQSDQTGEPCKSLDVRLTSGRNKGTAVVVAFSDDRPSRPVRVGDRILLQEVPGAPPERRYSFGQYQRRGPLALLALAFAAGVVWLGRRQGARALLGLALSIGILSLFVLPALLAGRNPVAVALAGSSAVMLVALYLSHGVNVRTSSAVLGTFASLAFTVVLAVTFVRSAALSGFAAEAANVVNAAATGINLQGLLLAGLIIGSLGVLDDVTVTQASAVWELHLANPAYGARDLYRSAVRVGRDHIASTVNTLVLAYAGASLPLMILFVLANASPVDVVNGEPVAQEVVRTLVGSIGLVASVPITTRLAAFMAARRAAPQP